MKTKQTDFWQGEFGKEYTDRNTRDFETWNKFFTDLYGMTKGEINDLAMKDLPKDIKILEVGCNTGQQLMGLQKQGFKNLYSIELQWYAIEKAKELLKNVNIIQGSGFDMPFKDGFFDLVCTNGVLIHIAPDNLEKIMDEMYRCSNKYIMGFEYYAESLTDLNYRGNKGFMWKGDYCDMFTKRFDNLKVVAKEYISFVHDEEKGNRDCVYLLEKV